MFLKSALPEKMHPFAFFPPLKTSPFLLVSLFEHRELPEPSLSFFCLIERFSFRFRRLQAQARRRALGKKPDLHPQLPDPLRLAPKSGEGFGGDREIGGGGGLDAFWGGGRPFPKPFSGSLEGNAKNEHPIRRT